MKAEIDYSKDPGAVTWVGERLLHQYWALLAPYFRDILLPPHRHPDGDIISWSWESGGERAISGAELNTVRKRLGRELELFADNLAREATAAHGEMRNQAALQELAATMRQCVTELAGKRDPELARYACRTSVGIRLHSWGARVAGQPFDPERRNSPAAVQSPATPQSKRRRFGLVWAFGLIAAGLIGAGIWMNARRADTQAAAKAMLDPGRETETRVNVARGKVVGAAEPHSRGQAGQPTMPSTNPSAGSERAGAPDVAAATASKTGQEERRGDPPQTRASPTTNPSIAAGSVKPSSDEVVVGTDPSLPANVVGMPAGRASLPGSVGPAPNDAESRSRRAPFAASAGEVEKAAPEKCNTPNAVSLGVDEAKNRTNATVSVPLPPKERGTEVTGTPADVAKRDDLKRSPVARAEDKEQNESGYDLGRREGPASDRSIVSVEGQSAQGGEVAAGAIAAPLSHRWHIRTGDWRVEMMADVILPTQPVRAGSVVDLESLRSSVQREQEAAKPALLRRPQVTFGCAFAPINAAADASWAWNVAPDGGIETTVIARCAELRWRTKITGNPVCVLRARGGEVVSRVSFEAEGGVTVESAEGIRASWFVVVASADNTESAVRDARLRWQTNSGLPLLPVMSQTVDRQGTRVVKQLRSGSDTEHLVLFDTETGWGLAGTVATDSGEQTSPDRL